jgi:hypothetical protein
MAVNVRPKQKENDNPNAQKYTFLSGPGSLMAKDASDGGDGLVEAFGTTTNNWPREMIHIRVLCSGEGFDADYDPKEVKIELTSDDDIFFHYVCS